MLDWILHAIQFPTPAPGRAVAAFLTSGLVALFCAPLIIRFLKRNNIAERTEKTPIEDEKLRRQITKKSGTPTMGGLIIALGTCVGCLLWGQLGDGQLWLALGCFSALAGLGLIDDWMKLTRKEGNGIKVRYKLLVQGIMGAAVTGLITLAQPEWWATWSQQLSWLPTGVAAILLVAWCALVLSVMSNAVNVTDGLDGLAGGLSLIALVPLAWILHQQRFTLGATSGELLIYVASLTGAIAGFLRYNWHPARIFMGDTGSLAIGGGIGIVALLSGVELALPFMALVMLMELASSILQIVWFKTTGRRILPISPLHHIWQQQDVPETHVVAGFLLTGFVVACLCTPLF